MSHKLQRALDSAISLIQAGRFAEARPLAAAVTRKAPRHPLGWNLLGIAASEGGDYESAIKCFRKAARLAPGDADFHNNLGEAERKAGRAEEALASFRAALAIAPDHAAAHNNLGAALNALSREAEAIPHLETAVRLRPDNHEAYGNLGIALLNQRRAGEALTWLERAYRLRPDDRVVMRRYGNALEQADRLEDALALYRQAAAAGDDGIVNQVDQISNLEQQGRKDEARALLAPLIAAEADDPGVARMEAVLARGGAEAEEAFARVDAVLARSDLSDDEREGLSFALGRLADSLGRWDAAFAAYREANRLAAEPYDHAAHERYQDRIEEVYAAGWQERLATASNRSPAPVFVVGMPRSGTTLTEQILDCHPEVAGAGELTLMIDAERALDRRLAAEGGWPAAAAAADAAMLDSVANPVLDELARLGGGAKRVIDKLPHNHARLGLIEQLFPDARVIHCTRNPLDTCLSCYFQRFYAGHRYSTDLAAIGAHYRLYARAMAHWRRVSRLPILDVAYEALVADQERLSREMVAFLGLDWDDACLRFDRSARFARTASYDQVRQPIYDRSVGRYRHYERHLGPLIEALGPLADRDADAA